MTTILVSGDGKVLDPRKPILYSDELAALRGDGIFETVLVRQGRACNLERHLARLAEGAAIAELPAPDVDALRRAVTVAAKTWGRGDDGMARLVFSRGREAHPDEGPTSYVTVSPVGPGADDARRNGLDVITLPTGRRADAPAWELAGVKALAYARNTAAARYARGQGAGEAIFLAGDGTVLEGTRSNVVVVQDGTLITPPAHGGILPGTTQAAVFALAAERGIATRTAPLTAVDLTAADAVWLLSSVTLAARVRTLDGQPMNAAGVDVAELAEVAAGRP